LFPSLLDTTLLGVTPRIGRSIGGDHPPPGQVGEPVVSVKIFDTLTANAGGRIHGVVDNHSGPLRLHP